MERFDAFYTEIAKEAGSIENFIDSYMSFLQRRTDFFYEADPGDKMGFPPGTAESMLASIFSKYQKEQYKKFPKKSIEEFNKKLEKLKAEKNIKNTESPSTQIPQKDVIKSQTLPNHQNEEPIEQKSTSNEKKSNSGVKQMPEQKVQISDIRLNKKHI